MTNAALKAFSGLVEDFRAGKIADGRRGGETAVLDRMLGELSKEWDAKLPGFPDCKIRYGSFRGVMRRGIRDEYLKDIIARQFKTDEGAEGKTIVNPVCVFGRHARDVARRLAKLNVVATDIDPTFNRFYERFTRGKTPVNYRFRHDNIFDPRTAVEPLAVVFFGACGSLSDAAMDYAVNAGAQFVICRTCCHENIGGNTTVVKRPTLLNKMYRFKSFRHARIFKKKPGFYFSDKYAKHAYPRSAVARGVIDADEFLEVARNTVDSDICRAIIDLDRYLLLVEKGYEVYYKGELFVAERVDGE